ncbi:F-box protein PP2-B10 [Citrus sinensis]|uniref:F-box protein PP2-B10 n=1 Tax=Citrus sinensis TaxID=2711 RepID=A0ACB8I1E5_CITSI|nr:F-box protein PP2-B10 [Citrus sinensis]
MNRESKMDIAAVDQLPVECISHIISLTTPRDACISSTKDLYFHLCHNPIIINNGAMSFSLEKESGKKCYMAGARSLCIAWGDTPKYWKWTSLPQSRFLEVAKLNFVCWLYVKARIETNQSWLRGQGFKPRSRMESPLWPTLYLLWADPVRTGISLSCAYLVFKFIDTRYGFETRPVDFGVYFDGSDNGERRKVVLDPPANMPKLSQDRGNGWMEIEMGEFFNETGEDGTVVCSVFGFDDAKSGIIIQGIELRPKSGR